MSRQIEITFLEGDACATIGLLDEAAPNAAELLWGILETPLIARGVHAIYAGPPVPEVPERVSVGWAVQVGSFGQEANAREQAQRLREAGYAAFIERAALDRSEVWRVKIGPEVQRDRALRVRDDIQKKLDLSGIVIAHP